MLALVLATASAAGALPGLSGSDPLPAVATGVPVSPAVAPLDLERTLTALARDESQTKQQVAAAARQAEDVQGRVLAYGRAYVRRARTGLLPVGGGFQALVEQASTLERLRRAAARALRERRQLAERGAALERKLAELRDRRAQLETQRRVLAQASTALLEAQDRARAFERAFSASGPSGHTAVYGAGVGPTDPSELGAGFQGMKGRLPLPLPGRAEVLPASRPGSDGPGLEMRAPLDSPVRAVYPGRVAFADDYAAYGKTVIVDHGNRYYTVSASLGEIGVAVGEELSTGTRLGTVGDTGNGPGLYFEIRHGVATIDPAEWFGI